MTRKRAEKLLTAFIGNGGERALARRVLEAEKQINGTRENGEALKHILKRVVEIAILRSDVEELLRMGNLLEAWRKRE